MKGGQTGHIDDGRVNFSLVLPLYNECEGISKLVADLVKEFRAEGIVCELVLVNNGSTDSTGDVLEDIQKSYGAIRVVNAPINQGYGWGIICGLREASGPVVGFMCGDGQITPADVTRVYRRLIRQDLELCKVIRVVRHDGIKRKLLSKSYNLLFRLLFPVTSADINGTPKFFRRRCYQELDLKSKDWFIDAEIMIKATQRNYRIGEVAVEFRPRPTGESNVRLLTAVEFVWNMLRYRLRRK